MLAREIMSEQIPLEPDLDELFADCTWQKDSSFCDDARYEMGRLPTVSLWESQRHWPTYCEVYRFVQTCLR